MRFLLIFFFFFFLIFCFLVCVLLKGFSKCVQIGMGFLHDAVLILVPKIIDSDVWSAMCACVLCVVVAD